jgi:cysteine synthase
MAMSLPDELKNDDQEIKRPPIVGEWFVVSPTKVSKSKRKLLKALGFTIVDMTEWQKTAKNDPKMPKDRAENYMIAKSNISRMVASCLSGNYHEKPPNPRAVPDYGS